MIDFDSFAKKNGEFTYNGRHYVLTREVYADDEVGELVYRSTAVCTDDTQDDMDLRPAYEIKWYPTDDFIELCEQYVDNGDHYDIDESDACDWDNPDEVIPRGAYTEDGRII